MINGNRCLYAVHREQFSGDNDRTSESRCVHMAHAFHRIDRLQDNCKRSVFALALYKLHLAVGIFLFKKSNKANVNIIIIGRLFNTFAEIDIIVIRRITDYNGNGINFRLLLFDDQISGG